MEALKQGSDALFILLGGIMVLAMHAGFAFLELGTVRKKNQVNALVKILVDFSVSTVAYFAIGYSVIRDDDLVHALKVIHTHQLQGTDLQVGFFCNFSGDAFLRRLARLHKASD